jgi:transcriptional regulator with PAS, ATPase and Fis domain
MSSKTVQPASGRLRSFHGIFTAAAEMRSFCDKLGRVAKADCTVHLHGETGTGKELAARALHAASARTRGPFLAVNCATFSLTLLESELFGHVRGAFTGAIRDHPGLFKRADGGTLLLDEVTEIPLEIQGRLLRVLQEKNFVPVGGTRPINVDVRIVSSTNRSLPREVAEGRFREDLGYRLRVVPLYLPPLRARSGDVTALFWHFLNEMNTRAPRRVERVTSRALRAIGRYRWPGNVRELHSVVEHAFAIGEGPTLDLDDLPAEVSGAPVPIAGPSASSLPAPALPASAEARTPSDERERILAALARHGGRKGAAAEELGVSRQTLWRKLYVYGLAGR